MIEINTPAGAPPQKLLLEVVGRVFDQVMDAASQGTRPPQLQPSVDRARAAQQRDDVEDLVAQLTDVAHAAIDVAHAAIASIVRVRAAEEDVTER